jgi:hypothetical protein
MKGSGDEAEAEKQYPERRTALLLVILAVAFLVAGISIYATQQPAGIDLVKLQWWAGATAKAMGEIRQRPSSGYRTALYWDSALITGYTIGLLLACWLGLRVFWTRRFRAWAKVGLYAAAVAGVCNIAQDLLLLRGLSNGLRGTAVFDVAEALSFAKFSALLIAAGVGIAGIAVTAARLAMSKRTTNHWDEVAREARKAGRGPLVIPPPAIERAADDSRDPSARPLEGHAWWKVLSTGPRTRWAQGFASPSYRRDEATGICVSGGGIRSASVALGALQALREAGVLGEADHLVSVSGGGYTVGGFQLAMTKATDGNLPGPAPVSRATPADAFDPGSPEEDHLRRHSSYLADGLGQWLVALGVLLRGVLSSLVIIGLTITTLGLAIGEFYRDVPITVGGDLAQLRPRFAVTGPHPQAPPYPAIPPGVVYAIAAAGAVTVLAYLAGQLAVKASRVRLASRIEVALLAVTILLAVVGVAMPALLWVGAWLTWPLGFGPDRTGSLGALTVLVTYLGAVAAIFWRNRTTIAKSAGTVTGLASKGPVNQVLPYSMIQLILLWISLAVLILVALLFGGWVATSALVHSWRALIPAGALAVLVLILDQTSLSLHPFYRRQLARAFAVRRVERDEVLVAEPYPDDEMTLLSRYGRRPPEGFPAVTFMATANITGQDRDPPGRPAVPFTLAHDYIGGPATGWVRMDFLEELVGKRLQADLTVEAAMAISGAAFASAMGSQTRFYEVFLAIANARLGAWLPNPFFVALKYTDTGNWTIPGLPTRRRLSYFAREIFAIHPSTGRMLLCTDGGHYDNLGLVELLRCRCTSIYCIDASGASQPLGDALAGAITLAREELGVEITLTNEALELVSGGWQQLEPADSFTDLNARLSKGEVIVGDIRYPAVARRPGRDGSGCYEETTGKIVFAQAVLTPDAPYQLLDFPQGDPGFPHDSTGDQWFNAGQFDSYQTLGHFIGKQAVRRMAAGVRPLGQLPSG